ncbi:unnamed protein product [Aphanomyces euteiches]|uniref:Uncharacterized protein n=1 Tax=Aphanomyces euteiches TaxID=100861 RepID=A0A6G0WVS3_9STRA|nr:hypothetical protein Ae201684_011207 [Aphanomyces euteiches]KAH9134872.1 hypothetical protein AeRB84_019479 [Aphanomyces euteiches]
MVENTYDALRDAIWDDDLEMLHHYMQKGRIDVNHTDAAGQTLLHLAAFWGRTDIVRALISMGGSMKTKNATGCTALDLAIHWGHSATAEIIRLRGGTSVWEEKMGLLQMQVEDLTTSLVAVEKENQGKEVQVQNLRAEVLELHARWTEAVDHFKAEEAQRILLEARTTELTTTIDHLHSDLERIKQDIHDTQLEAFRIDRERENAEEQRDAAIVQREQAITAQKAALEVQAERTTDWQAAERAAVIMETQRNVAFGERDKAQRRANLAAVELELQTERLDYAQKELKQIQEEAADFLHAKRQEEIRARRARRAVEDFTEDDKAAAMQAAKEYGKQLQHRRRNAVKTPQADDRLRQRVQTANALLTQQTQFDLRAFEDEFVHTIKTFAEDRQAKWTNIQLHNIHGRLDADLTALRPHFIDKEQNVTGERTLN